MMLRTSRELLLPPGLSWKKIYDISSAFGKSKNQRPCPTGVPARPEMGETRRLLPASVYLFQTSNEPFMLISTSHKESQELFVIRNTLLRAKVILEAK